MRLAAEDAFYSGDYWRAGDIFERIAKQLEKTIDVAKSAYYYSRAAIAFEKVVEIGRSSLSIEAYIRSSNCWLKARRFDRAINTRLEAAGILYNREEYERALEIYLYTGFLIIEHIDETGVDPTFLIKAYRAFRSAIKAYDLLETKRADMLILRACLLISDLTKFISLISEDSKEIESLDEFLGLIYLFIENYEHNFRIRKSINKALRANIRDINWDTINEKFRTLDAMLREILIEKKEIEKLLKDMDYFLKNLDSDPLNMLHIEHIYSLVLFKSKELMMKILFLSEDFDDHRELLRDFLIGYLILKAVGELSEKYELAIEKSKPIETFAQAFTELIQNYQRRQIKNIVITRDLLKKLNLNLSTFIKMYNTLNKILEADQLPFEPTEEEKKFIIDFLFQMNKEELEEAIKKMPLLKAKYYQLFMNVISVPETSISELPALNIPLNIKLKRENVCEQCGGQLTQISEELSKCECCESTFETKFTISLL